MLSLYASQSLQIQDGPITRDYIFFKDDKETNVFYVLPQTPTFKMVNKSPVFRFIKYRNATSDPKSKGGFSVFTVDLLYSNLNTNPTIKAQVANMLLDPNSPVVKAMRQRAQDTLNMCIALVDNNDQSTYDTLRQQLGYSPQEAQGYVEDYRSGRKKTVDDFLVLGSSKEIEFRAVTFTSAKAGLNLTDMSNTLIQKVINPASPNLLGDHQTVFTVEFTQDGATLFEQVMKEGKAGVVTVDYEVNFEARMPPSTVTVTYKSKQTVDYTRDVSRDTWGNQDKIEQTRNDYYQQNSSVEVEMGSIIGMSDEQVADLRKRLEDWGQQQLEDILNSKTSLDLTSLGDGSQSVDHFEQELSNVQDFTRIWSESNTIIYSPGNLAMQLPTIKSIIEPDDNIDNYFQEINTDDVFFQDQQVRTSVNTDWDRLGIYSVDVKVYYGPDMVTIKQKIENGQIVRNPDGTLKDFDPTRYNITLKEQSFNKETNVNEISLLSWAKISDNARNAISTYVYSYQIQYKGSNIQYKSPVYYTDDQVLTISVVDEVLQVRAEAKNLVNWEIVQSVRLDLKYEDPTNKISLNYFYQLDEENSSQFVPKPIGAKRLQPIQYKPTFYMKDGRQIEQDWISTNQTGEITLVVDDPFSGITTYTIVPQMGNIIDFIGITSTYNLASLRYQINKDFTFTSTNNNSQTWSVPVVINPSGANEGHLTYQGQMRENGQMKPISGDDGGTTWVFVGPSNILSVNVDPVKLDFTQYDIVTVYIKYKNQAPKQYDFVTAADPRQTFSVSADQGDKTYSYRIEVTPITGDSFYIPGPSGSSWTESDSTRLLVYKIIKDATASR